MGPNCSHTHPCEREAEEGLTPTEKGEALDSQGRLERHNYKTMSGREGESFCPLENVDSGCHPDFSLYIPAAVSH